MRFPISSNERRVRSQYGSLPKGQISRQQPQPKSGWLVTLGRALRDNAALIAALIALVGVIITQIATTNNAREALDTQTNNAQEGLKAQQQLEEDRAREAELQSYFDDMGEMLLAEENPLPEAKASDAVDSLARAKTLTILERLDAQRKRIVLQFLYESDLIDKDKSVVGLEGANLSGAYLRDAMLFNADLSWANLSSASLIEADLSWANLGLADLSGADLSSASLIEADLSLADLSGADLSGADLRGADLSGAYLGRAKGVTNKELESQAKSLEGATMPNGWKHD